MAVLALAGGIPLLVGGLCRGLGAGIESEFYIAAAGVIPVFLIAAIVEQATRIARMQIRAAEIQDTLALRSMALVIGSLQGTTSPVGAAALFLKVFPISLTRVTALLVVVFALTGEASALVATAMGATSTFLLVGTGLGLLVPAMAISGYLLNPFVTAPKQKEGDGTK